MKPTLTSQDRAPQQQGSSGRTLPSGRLTSVLRALIAFGSCGAASVFGQATPDRDAPETELASFKLPPGFEINLFASERDGVMKPIQIRWDARGRLWVVGSTTYPQVKPGEVPNDKVWILEDTKGSGYAD